MSAHAGPKKPYTEPKLPEPYEDLVSWIGVGGDAGSNAAEQAKARVQALLAVELASAIVTFNATTSRLNQILIALTAVLVVLAVLQLWR